MSLQPLSKEPRSATELIGPACHAQWFALWTHSHCEPLVCDQLVSKGFHAFLPTIKVWSRRGGARHLIRIPMFPGYLFVHHHVDKGSCIEILKCRGLARLLGERWDSPAVIPDTEIAAIQRIVDTDLPVQPHPYLCEGQRVRITDGPLTDVEGILIQLKPNKGHLILSVDLLHRSVAVEVDCTMVAPVRAIARRDGTPSSLSNQRFQT